MDQFPQQNDSTQRQYSAFSQDKRGYDDSFSVEDYARLSPSDQLLLRITKNDPWLKTHFEQTLFLKWIGFPEDANPTDSKCMKVATDCIVKSERPASVLFDLARKKRFLKALNHKGSSAYLIPTYTTDQGITSFASFMKIKIQSSDQASKSANSLEKDFDLIKELVSDCDTVSLRSFDLIEVVKREAARHFKRSAKANLTNVKVCYLLAEVQRLLAQKDFTSHTSSPIS